MILCIFVLNMQSKPLVSVIVPAYNVGEYLDECIESIVRQDYRDIEIVLVDDGSTDKSVDICDAWALNDSRIKVLHKKNGGLSSARNAGLSIAEGEWIRFVDGDDVLPLDSISCMINFAGHDLDMVAGRYLMFSKNIPVLSRKSSGFIMLDGLDSLREMLYQRRLSSSSSDKLFRRELFDLVKFKEGIVYEDLECMARLLPNCRKVAIISDVIYFYRKRPGSILSVFNRKRLDVLSITDEIYARMVDRSDSELIRAASDRRLSACFNIFLLLNRHGLGDDMQAVECWNIIKELRAMSLFNSNVRIKNKVGILLSYFGRRLFGKSHFVYWRFNR